MALMVLEGSGDSKRRDQRVGARGASSLKVTDAFWYALLAFLVTGSTWGYTFLVPSPFFRRSTQVESSGFHVA